MGELVFLQNNKVVTDSLTIAEMFNKTHANVLKDIRTQMEYAGEEYAEVNFYSGSYQDKNKQLRPKFDLTEEAFTLVAMSYNTKEAVQMKIKFIQEFKRMKEHIQKQFDTSQLSPELQMFNQLFMTAAQNDLELKRLNTVVEETKQQVNNIKEVVALNTINWRKDVNTMINAIAKSQGGFDQYKNIRNESYQLLEERAHASLSTRVTNKKRKMALEGVATSKVEKVSKLDVIGEDKRLLEIYLAIVKEMAIKFGVDYQSA